MINLLFVTLTFLPWTHFSPSVFLNFDLLNMVTSLVPFAKKLNHKIKYLIGEQASIVNEIAQQDLKIHQRNTNFWHVVLVISFCYV